MRDEPAGAESSAVAASRSAHAMATEATTGLPRFTLARPRWLTTPPIAVGRRGGWIALSVLMLATLAVVAYASSGPTVLVPRSVRVFPNWEAGPLHLPHRPAVERPVDAGRDLQLRARRDADRLRGGDGRDPQPDDALDRDRRRRPASDPAAESAAAAVGHLQLHGLRPTRRVAPHLAVHARDLVRALRSDLPVRELGQPQEPLRRAVHRRSAIRSRSCRCRSRSG